MDGTIDSRDVKKAVPWWPGEMEIQSWEVYAHSLAKKGHSDILTYAQRELFGKKLACILASAEIGPTLYSDTDVLWFSEPSLPSSSAAITIRMSVDDVYSYDFSLLEHLNCRDILKRPPLNAGIVFVDGPALEVPLIHEAVTRVAQFPHNFSEQTILALAGNYLGDHWPAEEIAIFTTDKDRLIRPGTYPRFRNWVARHYVSPVRQLFWIDALAHAWIFRR
jgi:hypothetical protein